MMKEMENRQEAEETVRESLRPGLLRSAGWIKLLWQFVRYCLVGGINTLIDVCILNIILWCFSTTNVQVLVGYNAIAYMSGALSSFFFNKYWTFRHTHRATPGEVRRFIITLVLEVLANSVLLWLAGRALQPLIPNVTLWGNASKLVAVAGGTVISYCFMRYWTFADRSRAQLQTREAGGEGTDV